MHPRKKLYAKEVFGLVIKICTKFSDNTKDAIPVVLNISNEDAFEIIKKVMIALPDNFFYNATPSLLYDMLAFISKNLVLFQVQENIAQEDYAYHLINFINDLSLTIDERYYSTQE